MDGRKDLETRADIEKLIDAFYEKVKQDDLIAFFFTDVVPVDWPKHLPAIYAFWESIVFGTGSYRGDPMTAHRHIHEKHPLEHKHFQRWLQLFTTNADEQPRLVASLGPRNHLVLRNHGLLAVGPDVPTAFNRLWTLQRACEIQLAADAGQGANRAIARDILERVPSTRVGGRAETNRLIFEAMLRRAGISR